MHACLLNDMLAETLSALDLPRLPERIVDAQGLPIDVSGDEWDFNDVISGVKFSFGAHDITNPWFEYALKRYTIHRMQRVSPIEAYQSCATVCNYLAKAASWPSLQRSKNVLASLRATRSTVAEALESLRELGVPYRFSRIRAWYVWCCDYLADLGFDADFAYQLQITKLPGMVKGVAVLTDDPEDGPLNDVEQIALRHALLQDGSMEYEHVQQRIAVWLALAFGRNAANYILLREEDLVLLGEQIEDLERGRLLKIPRIKKRAGPRELFKSEFLAERLASEVQALVDLNREKHPDLPQHVGRPLFFRSVPRSAMGISSTEWDWHLYSAQFTLTLQRCVERYGLISPRTGRPLCITTRRLRYTFATNRVKEGISAVELAEALDHSDLQHVRVYFDTKSSVVERLDRAAATAIAAVLHLFKGTVRRSSSDAINGGNPARRIRLDPSIARNSAIEGDLGVCGKGERCTLFPPYSCCGCDRYQPFQDALGLHTAMLDYLLERRASLLKDPVQSNRLAVQLDEVIYGCAEVVERIQAFQSWDRSS